MTVKELKQLLTNDNDIVYIRSCAGRFLPATRISKGVENPYNGQRNITVIS